ncbi:MAG: HAD family phosphatase [Erysipelotrichaceae bacterium]|nr:HAD family phosphatase [Erysipelotrichaceae bacterium]MBQ1788121.1 HAD family phosphatase [Erysipelotrichaceae bacterium]MBQ5805395.1 HAD family phosphatase [Erysipelotrichaceae bacterium]
MIKCIVCDLDGTLFYGFGNDIYDLSPESVKALDMMKENGIQFAISSGRQYPVARKIMEKYVHEYVPSCNMTGSIIFDHDQIVWKNFMDRKEIDAVYEVIKDLDYGYIECFKEDGVCISEIKDLDFYRSIKDHESKDTLFGFKENIDRFSELGKIMLVHKNAETCRHSLEVIRNGLEGIVDFTISTGRYLEVIKKGCDKKNIIDYLEEAYGYRNDEIAIVGDSENDTKMLKGVKYSYIMSHAYDELKRQCFKAVENVLEAVEDVLRINKESLQR